MDEKLILRLENLCAMLSSSNDGERAVAANKATEILASIGMNWRDLVRRAFSLPGEDGELQAYRNILQWNGLTEWERKFVSDLLDRQSVADDLSEKQLACLQKIIRKFKGKVHKEAGSNNGAHP